MTPYRHRSTTSLTVGVGIGLAMSIDTGEGKSVGDCVADFGEGVWNWGKGLLGG